MIYCRNASGCSDPTAGEAIANIMREEKIKSKKLKRKKQYKAQMEVSENKVVKNEM